MAEPYLGEIEFFAFTFPPKNWATCAGQALPIAQNQALFSLLGTTYGGDGIRTFNLPDLRSRVSVGQGSGAGLQPRAIGQMGGEESHTVIPAELPQHTHTLSVVSNAATPAVIIPGAHLPAVGVNKTGGTTAPIHFYGTGTPDVVMAATVIAPSNGALPHVNMMPYLALNACIALSGIFPSRS